MIDPAVKEQILNDLDRLSLVQQQRAAALVHDLVAPLPEGTAGKDLLRFAGTFDGDSLREMADAIENDCERVDPDGW